MKPANKVFIISDCHFPFHSKSALKKMLGLIKKEKPTVIIQCGDLLDQYVFSNFSKSAGITPKQDVVKGITFATKMWAEIQKIVPKAKCYQLLGNHDVRLAKRVSERLPELAEIFDTKKFYTFPGVKTLKSDRDYLRVDGVVYIHGWLSKSIDHARHFNSPTVHGHRHRPCIETDGRLWSMDVGFMASAASLPLSYTQSKFTKWRMACGIVECGMPRLIFL